MTVAQFFFFLICIRVVAYPFSSEACVHMTQSDGIGAATQQLRDVRGRDLGKHKAKQCCTQQALRRHQAFTSHVTFLSFIMT